MVKPGSDPGGGLPAQLRLRRWESLLGRRHRDFWPWFSSPRKAAAARIFRRRLHQPARSETRRGRPGPAQDPAHKVQADRLGRAGDRGAPALAAAGQAARSAPRTRRYRGAGMGWAGLGRAGRVLIPPPRPASAGAGVPLPRDTSSIRGGGVDEGCRWQMPRSGSGRGSP